MLKAFCLGVASAFILALISVVLARPVQYDLVLPPIADPESFLSDEGPVRSERSANISHILGVSRKIYIIMNRIGLFLQITPDGTVSGTDQDNDYSKYYPLVLNPLA
ncbi:UNVERIFIED_CONTAM: hypothetical protein PYX00_003610 [Menopon gallinae]|uniref:Uncharacterized protein n=1 Tax=Menopon gallinae TaxID=328185 RepID=A0AAW2I1T9_9NEOP